MPNRMAKTLLVDATAIVRAYPPMVIGFAAVLAGAALVFDVLYLTAAAPPGLVAISMVPLLAGLVACLVAAADDLGLRRPVVVRTVAAAGAIGFTNVAVIGMIAAMRRTGPSDWRYGAEAVVFAGLTVLCVAGSAVVLSSLAHSLGIELTTRMPEPKPKPVKVKRPDPLRVLDAPAQPAPPKKAPAEPPRKVETEVDEHPVLVPRVVNLDEARPVVSSGHGVNHADGRAARARHSLSVVPSPREPRRPPGYGR